MPVACKTINGVEIRNAGPGVGLMVPAHEYNKLLDLTAKLKECLSDMCDEHRLHGHITDASAHYKCVLEPLA